ncbi:hypothetical protein HQ560_09785 [bacterium]|nr:hypothetical protein [bacterium]
MSPEVVNGLFAVGGAVLGAIASGVISARQMRKAKVRKELSVLISRPSQLIAIDDRVAGDVEVRVSGEVVPTVYLSDITIANSGTEVLSEVEVPLSFRGEGKLLTISAREANFDFDSDGYESVRTGDSSANIKCSYLNAGDQVTVRAMLSGNPEEWKAEFRQPGVSLIQRLDTEGGVPSVFARGLYEAIRRNWLCNSYMMIAVPSYRRYVEEDENDVRNRTT